MVTPWFQMPPVIAKCDLGLRGRRSCARNPQHQLSVLVAIGSQSVFNGLPCDVGRVHVD
jgi:hypothetical protein